MDYTIDFSRYTDVYSAIDLLKHSIGAAIKYDFYHGRTTFKAVALTPSIPLTATEAYSLKGGSGKSLGWGGGETIAKYIVKARIIDENSPHSWIPDPCDPSKNPQPQLVMNLIMAHTTFIVYGDPKAKMRVPVKPGDVLSVAMTPRNGSYDLQYGRFLDVLDRTGGFSTSIWAPIKDCVPLAQMFPKFPPFGDGLAPGPKAATYNGIRGTQAINNGKLPMEVLASVDETYATPAKLLADIVPSFDALAKAYFEKFAKKLKINSSYRTYARQVLLSTTADGSRNPLAATPGTSRHGWGCAFDWQLTIGWGNQSAAARQRQFNCPEWQWMWNNSHTFAVDGVYWTSPSWARPKTGVGSASGGDAEGTGADPLGVHEGFQGTGRLLEAWHWEPSNFGSLISGIG